VTEFFQFVQNGKDAIATFAIIAGGAFALWRWMVDQRWRRVQYAQTLIKEFLEKESTEKAFEILDTDDPVDFDDGDETITIEMTDEFLIGALSTFDQKEDNTDEESIVRNIFDEFFNDLSIFQSYIEAKLVHLSDISPYLEYWMRALTGREKIRGMEFAQQAAKFLTYFGYKRVFGLGC
jgi:hypothetical protein